MNELFRTAASITTTVVSLVATGYIIKYGIDAWNGHYCLPVDSRYGVLRDMASTGNSVINLAAEAMGKKQCPAPPVFFSPS